MIEVVACLVVVTGTVVVVVLLFELFLPEKNKLKDIESVGERRESMLDNNLCHNGLKLRTSSHFKKSFLILPGSRTLDMSGNHTENLRIACAHVR